MYLNRIVLFLILLFFLSCQTGINEKKHSEKSPAKSVDVRYAKLFSIDDYGNYKILKIKNPWSSTSTFISTYILYKKEEIKPENNEALYAVETPVKHIAIQSLSNIGFLNLLSKLNIIGGITDPNLVYSSEIKRSIQSGKIQNIGTSMEVIPEKLLLGNYDLFIATSYNGSEDYQRLAKNGLSVLFNLDWMENHPLGRAEWIKVLALFTNQETLADSIFNSIEKSYLECKNRNKVPKNRDILVATSFKGTWYVPAGNSFKSILYKDAGASYFWSNDSSTGSLPLSFEMVFSKQKDADVWIDIAAKSTKELLSQDSRYALFKAFKLGELYNNFLKTNSSGGNDYWENGVCRPDLVLNDLYYILNSGLNPNSYTFNYYKKLD